MSDFPVHELASESPEVRRNAANAIADAVDRGTPLDVAAAEAMIPFLGNADAETRQLARYILQTDAERDPQGRTWPALRGALTSEAAEVRTGEAVGVQRSKRKRSAVKRVRTG